MDFLAFVTILIVSFLVFFLVNLSLRRPDKEFASIMTLLVVSIIGLFMHGFGVKIRPADLIIVSVSVFTLYLFFPIGKGKRGSDGVVKRLISDFNSKKRMVEALERVDLEEYFFLKLEYEKGNVKNKEFQKRYKNFYNMNPFGFTEEFYSKYFDMMLSGETDLRKILNKLAQIEDAKGKKTVQLAFATKLLHTVDSEMPLYNSTVAETFGFQIKNGTLDQKINHSIEIYEKLKRFYFELLGERVINEIIEEFRERKNLKEGVLSNVKIVDILIKINKNESE